MTPIAHRIFFVVLAIAFMARESTLAIGQTYTFPVVYSVEWLVDESNAIVVCQYENESDEVVAKIIRTLKGDAESIRWPLNKLAVHKETLLPSSKGRVRLLFIRGNSELLQMVELGRGYTQEPSIRKAFLGISQYGQLYLTAL
jgi:hypothetical protein